jgi:hypothetical protein
MLNGRRLEEAAFLGLTGCVLALSAACARPGHGETPDIDVPDPSRGAIWTDQSRAIDVSCYAYFPGGSRIRATRDQLSPEQLDMLAAMRLESPASQCFTDGSYCYIAVTAADGSMANYVSDASGACKQTALNVPSLPLGQFLLTLPCKFANEAVETTADGGVTPSSIVPDARCFNGVLASAPNATRLLVVDDPGIPRHLELDTCNGPNLSPAQVHPQLLALDGQTVLSEGTTVTDPGFDGTCWVLDYTFLATGRYPLSIGLDQGYPSTDLYLRFY